MNKNERSTQTPQSNKGFFKGILGGLIGGAVAVGATVLLIKPAPLTQEVPQSTNSTAKTSKLKLDVESNTSTAIEKVQDAVVSVVNLQKKEQLNDFERFFVN